MTRNIRRVLIESLKESFQQDEPKIRDYIVDSEIDFVIIGTAEIPADEFCNHIHKYMGDHLSETTQQKEN